MNESKPIFKTDAALADSIASAELAGELQNELLKFRDPVVLASIYYKLMRERESFNMLLREINARLERLEQRAAPAPQQAALLSETDEGIIAFIRRNGKACAEEVQAALRYKGKNAASARLNRLYAQGLLEKRQVGKKVFYLPK
jgi:predicted HTH transcriptional regulator